jgi:hypothetical protein
LPLWNLFSVSETLTNCHLVFTSKVREVEAEPMLTQTYHVEIKLLGMNLSKLASPVQSQPIPSGKDHFERSAAESRNLPESTEVNSCGAISPGKIFQIRRNFVPKETS